MVIECKTCGSEIEVAEGSKTVVCEFCGMEQTVPRLDDPRKIELFVQANEHRMACRFDVAKKKYEGIIKQFPDDNEAYWCKLLCEYGIEYVDDFNAEKKLPTCHRTVKESIFKNTDYKFILSRATAEEKAIYESEAKEIDRIQREILTAAGKEEPYDIFICYKDSDTVDGVTRRTVDSQYANKIYTNFTNKGFKVFFSRVTLRSKAGAQYEPIIYSALSSAKVMLLVCANKQYVDAPWVRNEWSRFAEFAENDYTKVLVPCLKDVDPYDLPEELSRFQALDMGEMDFFENLTRQINSKFGRFTEVIVPQKPESIQRERVGVSEPVQPAVDAKQDVISSYLRRIDLFIEDGDWAKADEYAEKILDINPEYGHAYLVKLLIEYRVKRKEDLPGFDKPFENSKNYAKAIRFGDATLKKFLTDCVRERVTLKENARKDGIYKDALAKAESDSVQSLQDAVKLFGQIAGWKDADKKRSECERRIKIKLDAEERKRKELERKAEAERLAKKRKEEEERLAKIRKEEEERLARERKAEAERVAKEKEAEKTRQKEVFAKAKLLASSSTIDGVEQALSLFRSIPQYKGVAEKITECEQRLNNLYELQAKMREEQARREDEEKREKAVCEPLFKQLQTAREKAEIDKEISENREKLSGLIEEVDKLKKKRTDYIAARAEMESLDERIGKIGALRAKLRTERSGLSFFAMKARKEIDAKLDDCVKELSGLESRLEALKQDWYIYKSVDEIDAAIRKQETEITLCKNAIDKLSKEKCKEDIKTELLKYGYGKRIIEDMERQKLEEFKNKILNAKVGDLIAFGKRNYDEVNSDEPLYWRVLENKGNTVFVMANNIFKKMAYSSRLAGGDWCRCAVRTWLDKVYETAFSDEEKQYIVEKHFSGANSYLYPLSVEQVRKFLPNMDDRKMGDDWWVRTVISSFITDSVMYVNSMGRIITAGMDVSWSSGVVPAMQLKFK